MNTKSNLAKLAVNKSLLKEYSNSFNERIVYMNDGTEFQIQIFNPYDYIIGVSFSFNEEHTDYSNNLLVLRPGERVWLDRYLNNDSKLLFSTYKVDDSREAKNAIKENGKIHIKFFREQEAKPIHVFNSNSITSTSPWPFSAQYTNITCELSHPCDRSQTYFTSGSIVGSASEGITCSASSANTYNIKSNINSIETGRIEQGGASNQKFSYVDKTFNSFPFAIETIHIYPTSRKPITSSELTKRYCHNCGRKLNQKFKFCPYCGTKQ